MKILKIVFLLCCVWATILHAAPQPGRTYRLLILDSQLGNPYDEVREAMLAKLASFGYREGDNLVRVTTAAGNDVKQGESILRGIADNGYDVVFTGGTVATIAAKNVLYGKQIPVVFGSPTDPVGIGVIDDFDSMPKANFTGVCYPVPVEARMRFVRQLLPQARTFGLIYADMPQSHSYNRWLKALLASHPDFKDITILFRPVPLITGEQGDIQMAENAIPLIEELNDKVDAFLKPNDQMGTRRHLAEVIASHADKPLIGIVKNDVMEKWGATAVIFPSHESIGQQAAEMIRDLFEGAPINTIRPQWPALYGYGVDMQKVKQFHIKLPIGIIQLSGKNIVK